MYPGRLTYTTCMSLFLLSHYNENGGETWSSVSTDAVPGRAAAWTQHCEEDGPSLRDGPLLAPRLEHDMRSLT